MTIYKRLKYLFRYRSRKHDRLNLDTYATVTFVSNGYVVDFADGDIRKDIPPLFCRNEEQLCNELERAKVYAAITTT